MKIKVLSSIPGRMRIRTDGLLYNENTMYFLKETLQFYHGIVLVSPNSVTGNMIVCYDVNLINALEILERITSIRIQNILPYVHNDVSKRICKSKFKKFLFRHFINKYPIKIYSNEVAISRRLLILSVIISGLSLCVSFNLMPVLSLMILGFPGILFFIRSYTYQIVQENFKCNEFYFKDSNLLYELSKVEHLIIEDSILNYEVLIGSQKSFIDFNNNNNIQLIKSFRNLGLNDIYLVSRKNDDINSCICYILGINKIELDSQITYDRSLFKNFYNKDKTAAIIESYDLRAICEEQNIIFLRYKTIKREIDDFIITYRIDRINKIPYIIETSKYCDKLVIRSENIAVTVNTMGIFLATVNIITPLSSITLYLLNYLINIIYIKSKLSQYEKEHLNEVQI